MSLFKTYGFNYYDIKEMLEAEGIHFYFHLFEQVLDERWVYVTPQADYLELRAQVLSVIDKALGPRRPIAVKTFFLWLAVQLFFGRILFGMAIYTWRDLHIGADSLPWFVVPAMLIIGFETIASAMVVYPLILSSIRKV